VYLNYWRLLKTKCTKSICDPRNGKPKYLLLDIIFYIIQIKITSGPASSDEC
jgi:hypothetical protein